MRRILARKTVLASGGLGQIFLRTTNPPGSRGDGIGMAWRAGVRIINAEYVQFHPTCFYSRQAARFLISEAVRGAGARLVDAAGEPFMQHYAPEWKDLARATWWRGIRGMLQRRPQRLSDLRTYVPQEEILSHFPTIRPLSEYGWTSRDLMPVVPAAHYFCGGVWVDDWGQTTHQHLYAVGEVRVRLARGQSSRQHLAAGGRGLRRAARHILEHLPAAHLRALADIPPWQDTGEYDPDPALISQDMSSIKHIM